MLTNTNNLSLSVSVWLATDNYDHTSDPKHISATSLLKPIKSLILGRRATSSSVVDVSQFIPSRVGTAVHTAIEQAWNSPNLKTRLRELRLGTGATERILVNPCKEDIDKLEGCIPVYMEIRSSKKVLGYTVSGKFDFVMEGVLEDFKNTTVYNYMSQSNAENYIQQGSIYKWLNPEKITEGHMKVQYILNDWSNALSKRDKNYPDCRITPKIYNLYSETETEKFVTDKIELYDRLKDSPEKDIPNCTKEELWQGDSVFKYYKNPAKTDRSTKNFTTWSDAQIRFRADGSIGKVLEVKALVKRCTYCPAIDICEQAQGYIKTGMLIY